MGRVLRLPDTQVAECTADEMLEAGDEQVEALIVDLVNVSPALLKLAICTDQFKKCFRGGSEKAGFTYGTSRSASCYKLFFVGQ